MAKRKRGVALFEVIASAKHPPVLARQRQAIIDRTNQIRPPKAKSAGWWSFWKRPAAQATIAAPEVANTPQARVAKPLMAPVPASASWAEPVAIAAIAPPSHMSHEPVFAQAHGIDAHEPPIDATPVPTPVAHIAPALRIASPIVETKPEAAPYPTVIKRRLPNFRVTYTTAVIGGFAVVVIVGLSLLARQWGAVPPSGDDPFYSAPQRADALDVGKSDPAPEVARPIPKDRPPVVAPPKPEDANRGSANVPAQTQQGRVIGLNYVVVQSFADEPLARTAAKMLGEAGIGCTIEAGLPNYAGAKWFVVVGTVGFDASTGESSGDYRKYVDAIREVGRQFAVKTNRKTFAPQRYKWQAVR